MVAQLAAWVEKWFGATGARRAWALPLLVAGLVGALGAAERAEAADAGPNIVLILADDLGYGDLGCYGQMRIRTPRIDQMAREGVRFTQCYSGSTVCAPSRGALLTGRHCGHGWIRGNGELPLRGEDLTLAEALRPAGYHTAAIGKWGLGTPETTGHPLRQGFHEFFGYADHIAAHNYYPEYLWRDGRHAPLAGNAAGGKGQYSIDVLVAEALAFLQRQQGKRFFLYLSLILPHANNELGRATGNGMEVPSDEPYSQEAWPQPQRNHAAMITRLDAAAGAVLDKLAELGLDENTLVLFTSDNGPHHEAGANPVFFNSSGSLRGHKRDLYEGGIRVPLVARWPGKIAAGRESPEVVAFWDVLPTFCELAGTAPAAEVDGRSFAPALVAPAGSEAKPREDFLYWEFHERGFQQAARHGDWKGVSLAPSKPLELYDLAQDPGETRDVAAEHPEVVKKFQEYLATVRTPSRRWPGPGRPSTGN